MKKTIALALILFTTFTMSAQNKYETKKRVEETNKQLKPVEEYVESIKVFVDKQTGPHIVVADISDYNNSEKPEWVKYDSEEAFEKEREKGFNRDLDTYTTAYIWKKDGKGVQINFTYSSPSGDWAQYVFYTFYPDGTAARIDRELRTFMGDIIVNRVFFYDQKGKLLKESKTFRDLETKELVKEPESFMDIEVELYTKTNDLPFATLLETKEPLPCN